MITINNHTILVTNGEDGKANIAVSAGIRGEVGLLRLQKLSFVEVEIGSLPHNKQITELPRVDILFNDIKSIDIYIEALNRIKSHMVNKSLNYVLAC